MRLSATVKEYIKKEISKRHKSAECDRLEKKKRRLTNDYSVMLESLKNKVYNLVTKEIELFYEAHPETNFNEFPITAYNNKQLCLARLLRQRSDDLVKPSLHLDKIITDLSIKLTDEKEEIYNNIIVSMELGGTKADLDKMLAEIGD